MKTVLKNLPPITHISLQNQPPSHVKSEKIGKGQQYKEDKRVEEGLTFVLIFISSPLALGLDASFNSLTL